MKYHVLLIFPHGFNIKYMSNKFEMIYILSQKDEVKLHFFYSHSMVSPRIFVPQATTNLDDPYK